MVYLTISADYLSTGLKDEHGSEIMENELKITSETWSELQNWVMNYSYIIPLEQEDRMKIFSDIEKLDREGLYITNRIQEELGHTFKVRYYSEGKLKFLYPQSDSQSN